MKILVKSFPSAHLMAFLMSVLISHSVQAKESGPSAPTSASALAQKEWLLQFKGFFVTGLCEKKEYVTTCLGSSVSECKLAVNENTPACSQSIQLPSKIQIGKDSELWGEKMGRCLSPKLVNTRVLSTKKGDPKCAQLSNW